MGGKKKTETNKSTEKVSKTPQPPSQKNLISGKDREKEKNYGESFQLWIPEPLENLEVQIHSRKRILEVLNEKTENIDGELKQSILVRDQQINTLNKTILGLKNELKSYEELAKSNDFSEKLGVMQKTMAEMAKEKELYEENIMRIKEEFEEAKANWDDEKDSFMLQQEAVVDEKQGLIGKIHAKDLEIKAVKDDILQMIKVGNEMTLINNDLLKKIQSLQENIEEYREKISEVQIKAELNEEIAVLYQKSLDEKKEIFQMFRASETKSEALKIIFDVEFKKDMNMLVNLLVAFQTDISKIEGMEDNMKYHQLIDQIEVVKSTIKNAAISADQKNLTDFSEFNLGSSTDIRLKELEIKEKHFQNDFNELKNNSEKFKKDSTSTLSNLTKLVDTLRSQNFSILEKNQNLQSESEKKDSDLHRYKSKLSHQQARLESALQKSKEILQKESEYKASLTNLQQKLNGMVEERKSSTNQLNIREKRIKSVLTQIQVLREEIFNKDSELLKKSRELIKLEHFLDSLKAQLQKVNTKNKLSDGEILAKVNTEIEAKDQQIAMLKEMLRASNQELKAKEGFISHYKRKSENINSSSIN